MDQISVCDIRPNKHCIPTHCCGQAVYLVLEVHDILAELDEHFSLNSIVEVIRNHVFSGAVLDI